MAIDFFMIPLILSLDLLIASFAYGSNRKKINFSSNIVINIICISALALAFFAGTLIIEIIPENIAILAGSLVLFILGIIRLIDSLEIFLSDKKSKRGRKPNIKPISQVEAIALGIALSLDAIPIGLSTVNYTSSHIVIVITTFFTGASAVILGQHLGFKLTKKSKMNLSWIGGVALILLAFFMFLF